MLSDCFRQGIHNLIRPRRGTVCHLMQSSHCVKAWDFDQGECQRNLEILVRYHMCFSWDFDHRGTLSACYHSREIPVRLCRRFRWYSGTREFLSCPPPLPFRYFDRLNLFVSSEFCVSRHTQLQEKIITSFMRHNYARWAQAKAATSTTALSMSGNLHAASWTCFILESGRYQAILSTTMMF
jgi:hypothetical protein